MKSVIIAAIAAVGIAAAGSANAQEALAKSSGCLNCHDVAAKKIGPAFKDVAAKYKGKKGAEGELVAKIKEGKGHMKIDASEAELKAAVGTVLSTK